MPELIAPTTNMNYAQMGAAPLGLMSAFKAFQDAKAARASSEQQGVENALKMMKLKREAAGAGGDFNAPNYEDKLRKTLQDEYGLKGYQKAAQNFKGLQQAYKMGTAGDLQLIYSFIRMLDPDSVVREGEVALVNKALGLLPQLQKEYDRATTTGTAPMLTPALRNAMYQLASGGMVSGAQAYQRKEKDFNQIVGGYEGFGVDPKRVIPSGSYINQADYSPEMWNQINSPSLMGGASPQANVGGESEAERKARRRKELEMKGAPESPAAGTYGQ